MKNFLAVALIMPLLASCTTTPAETPTTDKLAWYDSREEALLKGLKKKARAKKIF